jgi:hypothetical protein
MELLEGRYAVVAFDKVALAVRQTKAVGEVQAQVED